MSGMGLRLDVFTVIGALVVATGIATAHAWRHPAPEQSKALPEYPRSLLLESAAETSANISFGDLDGDGHLDVVLAKGRHWPLVDRVLLGDGRGGIRTAHDLGTASDRSYSALLADVDRDGSLDVVISNDAPDPKVVYLNDGKGRFRVGSTFGRPEWATRNASVADMNGDGLPDIIAANRTARAADAANYVCLNRGRGRFDADCSPFARYPATTITPADFNHDGLIDVVVPHRDGGQSYVYLADRRHTLSDAQRVPFGPPDATIRMAKVADLNGDGLLDIVAIDERTGVSLHLGQPDGGFGAGTSIEDRRATPYALEVGDLDRDGTPDIVVGHVKRPSAVLFNDGAGRHFTRLEFGDQTGTVYGFAIGDVDRDGVLDIGAARSEAPNVIYFGALKKSPTPGPRADQVRLNGGYRSVTSRNAYAATRSPHRNTPTTKSNRPRG